ncbi:MAG TPA: ASKHA domain-containing protein [Bacillota bacterium]|nr:ASKHA domain-containing protein [Bacillota bacterium]
MKSSICTGAEILMEKLGVAIDEVGQVLIAGAFGNYIDLESAITLGLIPQSDLSRVHLVGNAAGTGAVKALLSRKHLDRCYTIAKQAGFVELANHPAFQNKFVSNLSFRDQ